MQKQSPAYINHLRNLQNEADAQKLKELQANNLFNEKSFYQTFSEDMLKAKKEVVIYSPFISKYRSEYFRRVFTALRRKNIPIFIFTRPLEEHEYFAKAEIACALRDYEEMGANITYLKGYVHEKLAVIDREILWEGSLNILSQRESREIMRRFSDETLAKQTMSYLGLEKKLAEAYKFQYERMYHNLAKNLEENKWLKVKLFFSGVLLPFLAWGLFAIVRIMIVSLKGVKLVFSLVNFLYK
jgi:phosphatidylserine/phosphatidylglycerophosphate/cardiolipin synthase-like enzyme